MGEMCRKGAKMRAQQHAMIVREQRTAVHEMQMNEAKAGACYPCHDVRMRRVSMMSEWTKAARKPLSFCQPAKAKDGLTDCECDNGALRGWTRELLRDGAIKTALERLDEGKEKPESKMRDCEVHFELGTKLVEGRPERTSRRGRRLLEGGASDPGKEPA